MSEAEKLQNMEDNRPPAYWEEDGDGREIAVFRASGVTACPTALTAMLLGFDPEPWPAMFREAFKFGQEHEGKLREEWLAANPEWELESMQDQMEWNPVPGWKVRGHHDGIVRHRETGKRMLIEIKWLGEDLMRAFWSHRLFQRMPGYLVQKALYQEMTGLGMMYLVGDKKWYKETGKVLITQKEYPPLQEGGEEKKELAKLMVKLSQVVAQVKTGELGEPAEGCGSGKYWPCQTSYLHEKGREGKGRGVEDMNWETEQEEWEEVEDEEFAAVIAEYAEVGKKLNELEGKKKELGKKLREGMAGRKKVRSGGVTVTWVKQERTNPDVKKMKEDGVFDRYSKTVEIEFPRVTRKKEG